MKTKMYQEVLDQPQVLQQVLHNFESVRELLELEMKGIKKLFLFGTGASLNACYGAVDIFVKYMAIYPVVLPAAEVDKYLPIIDGQSFVIVISQSGESYETKQLCNILLKNEVAFCGITNDPESTLAKSATVLINLQAGIEVSSATKTHTASLMYLYLIAMCAGGKEEQPKDIIEAVQTILTTQTEKIHSFAKSIYQEPMMYVLSDNLNYATARQGGLMFKEKVLICAEGMTVSEFRHGAIEVAREGMVALLISTEEKFKKEFENHAAHLRKLKMKVFLISDTVFNNIPEEDTIIIPKIKNELCSSITATIPLQLLAEEMARLNNYDVDDFIHLSKIVGSY